jgi:hypothetical protein
MIKARARSGAARDSVGPRGRGDPILARPDGRTESASRPNLGTDLPAPWARRDCDPGQPRASPYTIQNSTAAGRVQKTGPPFFQTTSARKRRRATQKYVVRGQPLGRGSGGLAQATRIRPRAGSSADTARTRTV